MPALENSRELFSTNFTGVDIGKLNGALARAINDILLAIEAAKVALGANGLVRPHCASK